MASFILKEEKYVEDYLLHSSFLYPLMTHLTFPSVVHFLLGLAE